MAFWSTPFRAGRLWRILRRAATWPFRLILRITRDGLLFALLALACAIVAARTEELANIPLLVGLVLFSVLATALILSGSALKALQIRRWYTERVFAGEPLQVTLGIENRGRLPAAGLTLTESLHPQNTTSGAKASADSQRLSTPSPESGGPPGGRTFAMAVPGHGQERTRYTLTMRRRGLYRFGETQISTTFPFGFWRSIAQLRLAGRLVVYPRLGQIDREFFQELERSMQRLRRSKASREELDFRSLREYRHGDNPKWIHWKSSARQARPLVKEFEEPQSKRVLILLDTNLQRVGVQRLGAFELAISFAATAARELAKRGCEVSCCMLPPGGEPVLVTVSRERRNLDRLLEALAGIRPDPTRTLADLNGRVDRTLFGHAYVLALGLGSLRLQADLRWAQTMDNQVKVLDVRGEEFRGIFRRAAAGTPSRGQRDEDLLLELGDEELAELSQEELALVS